MLVINFVIAIFCFIVAIVNFVEGDWAMGGLLLFLSIMNYLIFIGLKRD